MRGLKIPRRKLRAGSIPDPGTIFQAVYPRRSVGLTRLDDCAPLFP